jgi:hypothetical protein
MKGEKVGQAFKLLQSYCQKRIPNFAITQNSGFSILKTIIMSIYGNDCLFSAAKFNLSTAKILLQFIYNQIFILTADLVSR